ncbi:hypothetical protein BSL78_05335 [Apostichopus japonicus]|uniref:MAPEG family protein n=1 Tax=Stichopus japonicus TaxID=307972 RepID=A0A2G8LBX3_STIJA|nr:hypothetical protein BSL78_05335 [Apostichopus japonicus]
MENRSAADQQTVRLAGLFSFVLILSGCYLAVNHLPLPTPQEPTLTNRLVFTLRCLVVSMIPLMFGIARIATWRFNDMENMGSNPVKEKLNYKAAVATKYLQNTVEQTILHVLFQLALSTFLPTEYLAVIPMFVFIFVIGRFLFFYGYMDESKPVKRALGFALTWVSNVLSFVSLIVFLFWRGPDYKLSG